MSCVTVTFQEGFANRMSQYAIARAYAEKYGCVLQTPFWMGQEVFEIDDPPVQTKYPDRDIEKINEWDGEIEINLWGWGTSQKSLIYSRADAKRWFKIRPHWLKLLEAVPKLEIAAHLRWGDYLWIPEARFIAIAKESYLRCADHNGLNRDKVTFVSEETAIVVPGISQGIWNTPRSDHHTQGPDSRRTSLGFLPDFYALMTADVLMRSNSTFGWWAGNLGNHSRIFSPDLKGLCKEKGLQDVPFVEGNHAPISCLHENCTELRLRET